MEDGIFKFWLELPLALGTVGGLTSLHPMVKLSLEMLENPDASKLMQIVATLGLAQNFAALRSLTTSGIQVGHMKMHLNNMLNQYQATQEERVLVMQHFTNQTISHSLVIEFLEKIRKNGEKAIL
jgi:hydroxymethylglutaryl-CoA reductase